MKKVYIKPLADRYAVSTANLLEGSLNGGNEEGDGNQLSKDTDWEDDELDGGSPIW